MPPVEIQWCDHSSVLLEYLRQLYEEGRFVDVGLECEGRQVKAHKAVISACSPYLEGLLKGNPARSHLIKFNGYSYNSLRAVIDFMYNGKVMVEQEQLAAFLKLGRALQVRGILDIAAQCEEAGLTTAEETKSNAQYSTTVQQPPKGTPQTTTGKTVQQSAATAAETKKYAFLLDKGSTNTAKKPGPHQFRKVMPNIIGTVDQQGNIAKVQGIGAQQVAQQQTQHHQTVQQAQPTQTLQQVVQQGQTVQRQQVQQAAEEVVDDPQPQAQQQEAAPTTLEELQQALQSGQAILQTTDNGSEQTLQMVEGQCVVTGTGQTYVVVQEGDNISFVPAEMVQGDLGPEVNGGQVVEGLDPVEQQLAQMEGQVLTHNQVIETPGQQQHQTSGGASQATVTSGDSGSLDTMSVVESLVKLGEKHPTENENGSGEEATEVGASMPCLGEEDETGAGEEEMETEDVSAEEDTGKRRRQPTQKMIEAMGMLKRKVPESPTQGGRGKKLKN